MNIRDWSSDVCSSDLLAIDIGARWVATCAFLSDRKTTFYAFSLDCFVLDRKSVV